jgi:hypothetical protein
MDYNVGCSGLLVAIPGVGEWGDLVAVPANQARQPQNVWWQMEIARCHGQ